MNLAFAFFLAFAVFQYSANAQTVTKVINGRVEELRLEENKLVLNYQNPVTLQKEKLVLKVSERTGFSEGLRFEDLQKGEPLSIDYEEDSDGAAQAQLIKRVPLQSALFQDEEKTRPS